MLLFCLVMTQPEFVINERTMTVMGKDLKGNPKYFEKASFSITLLRHVEVEGQDSGFLSLVKSSITGKDKYVTRFIFVLLSTESYLCRVFRVKNKCVVTTQTELPNK